MQELLEEDLGLEPLDSFLDRHKDTRLSRNAYVFEAGFHDLYVRFGPRYLDGVKYEKVVDIANVQANQPGRGVIWRLFDRLLARGLIVYVECVLNTHFAEKLEARGFTKICGNCFYRFPDNRKPAAQIRHRI
jgi:hypothetical protein